MLFINVPTTVYRPGIATDSIIHKVTIIKRPLTPICTTITYIKYNIKMCSQRFDLLRDIQCGSWSDMKYTTLKIIHLQTRIAPTKRVWYYSSHTSRMHKHTQSQFVSYLHKFNALFYT